MTIETKYNIGDKVWVKIYRKTPMRGKIVGYKCEIDCNIKEEFYLVHLDFVFHTMIEHVQPDKVFTTKKELLKSL
jgi:hypothetical protein